MLKLEILYQDDYIVVVNKPSGLLSVSFDGNRSRTAQQILEDLMRKNGSFNAKHRPLAVHRLDRDTSGVMMFALGELAQQKIMDNWHTMVSERLYRAVAENPRNPHAYLSKSGLIDDPLAFNAHNIGYVPKSDENVETVPARTSYKTIVRGKTHTLFELSLDTGKKNQIRAHLASKGYPLAGDENYRARTNPFGRLALHARTLDFTHPFTEKPMHFEVPEPAEWESFVVRAASEKTAHEPTGAKPSGTRGGKNSRSNPRRAEKSRPADEIELGQKRLSRKDRAHMNFIEQGKHRSGR